MASQVKFPVHNTAREWREWADQLTTVLQKFFGFQDSPDQVGSLVLYTGNPPEGVIASGSTFSGKAYPILAKQLGGTAVPPIAAPAGFKYGVLAR